MTAVAPGRLTLDLSLLGTRVATRHDAVEDVVGRGPTAVEHAQRLSLGDVRLTTELGLLESFAVGALLPWRAAWTGIEYVDAEGRAVALSRPDVHHRDETLTGPGDPWLWGRYSRAAGPYTVGVRAGLTLPLGRTEPDPFRLGAAGLPHQHLQFGTGTFDPLFGVEVMRRFDGFSLLAWGTSLQTLYRNRHGHQAGDRYAASLSALSPLGTERFTFQAGAELQAETPERWHGRVPEEEGNRGRLDLLGLLLVSHRVRESLDVGLSVRVPAYVHARDAQLSYPLVAMLSLTAALDIGRGSGAALEDGHEEEEDPEDPAPPDILDVTTTGEAVSLEPVAGKLTVFDFWAPWCVPCRDLDERLLALARRHPDRLAVRKVNVVDADSPAWQRYIAPGTFPLPHVKVFDPRGELVLERSAPPRPLAEEIERLLTPREAVPRASGRGREVSSPTSEVVDD